MKEKLLIVGTGALGRVVLEYLSDKYDCSFVDDTYEEGQEIGGARVVGSTARLEDLHKDFRRIVVALDDNVLRQMISERAKIVGYYLVSVIFDSAYVSPDAKLDDGAIVLNNALVQTGAVIGCGAVICPGAVVQPDTNIDIYSLVGTNSVVRTYSYVGKRVRIGSGCVICSRVDVPDDTLIDDGTALRL